MEMIIGSAVAWFFFLHPFLIISSMVSFDYATFVYRYVGTFLVINK